MPPTGYNPPKTRPNRAPDAAVPRYSASVNGITDRNRPQPLWQPPPTACLTAFGVPSLLMHRWYSDRIVVAGDIGISI